MSGHRSFAILRARTRGNNGVAERFIRTLKENLLWVRTFKTIEELRAKAPSHSPGATMKLARRAAWIQNAREGQRGANHATNCD